MKEERQDRLIACLPERNPNFSFLKRKRRKSFRIMKELLEIEGTHRPKRDTHDMANETRRVIKKDLNNQVEIISSVMERAERVQAELKTRFPCFVKPMIRSNITGGFWLSLPKLFCELHLPSHDINITLVDESHKEYYTKYLPERRGLSAGWRGFSISHNLEEGDVLVFHLVGVCKMKVYIVRANHFGEVDAALSLLHLQAHAEICMRKNQINAFKTSFRRDVTFKDDQSFKSRPVMNDTQNISKNNCPCFTRTYSLRLRG